MRNSSPSYSGGSNRRVPAGVVCRRSISFSAELAAGPSAVVRALRVLRQEGWIDTQQGKGSFVRGSPRLLAGDRSERRGQAELDRDESREDGELVSAGQVRRRPTDRGAPRRGGGHGAVLPQAADPAMRASLRRSLPCGCCLRSRGGNRAR